jgi:hypothetical protein
MRTNLVIALALSAFLASLCGCASPTKASAMKTGNLNLNKRHAKSVAVKTAGGSETNPMWTSQIGDAQFLEAVEQSILENKLFTSVLKIGEADYVLQASLVRMDQPVIGFDMTVSLEVTWSLTRKGEQKPQWEKSFRSQARKSVGDAFVAVTRLRMATEAAAQNNIAEALNALAALELQ